MLREEFLPIAARVHATGARFLRDSAAVLMPCCTLNMINTAFDIRKSIDAAEHLTSRSTFLCEGLIERPTLTKYTALTEARTALTVELDRGLTARQQAAERKRIVPVGTRADVYDGYIALSLEAIEAVNGFTAVCDRITGDEHIFALPRPLVAFLRRVCADYGAASALLAGGESATLLCRRDDAAQTEKALRHYVAALGVDEGSFSLEDLAARSGSGMIAGVPPLLFDLLLRYKAL